MSTALVHGNDGTLVPPAFPPLSVPELQAVLSPAVRAVTWTSPRPLSSAGLVDLGGRTVLVKRHDARVRRLEDLEVEHALAAHLRERGVPVPDVLDRVAAGRWTYEVHALGRGTDAYRDVPSWQPHRSAAHARATGAALARLTLAAASFERPARQGVPLVSGWQVLRSPDLSAALEAHVARRPALRAALRARPWHADVRDVLVPRHAALLPHLPALPEGWTHGDGHPSNLLWSADEVTDVLDLGLADRTTALLDLAVAVERSCVSWLEPRPRVVDEHVAALLEGWTSVRDDDLAPLPALLPLAQLEFALSELEHFTAVTGSSADADAAYAYAVDRVRWFDGPEGRRLLALVSRDPRR